MSVMMKVHPFSSPYHSMFSIYLASVNVGSSHTIKVSTKTPYHRNQSLSSLQSSHSSATTINSRTSYIQPTSSAPSQIDFAALSATMPRPPRQTFLAPARSSIPRPIPPSRVSARQPPLSQSKVRVHFPAWDTPRHHASNIAISTMLNDKSWQEVDIRKDFEIYSPVYIMAQDALFETHRVHIGSLESPWLEQPAGMYHTLYNRLMMG